MNPNSVLRFSFLVICVCVCLVVYLYLFFLYLNICVSIFRKKREICRKQLFPY